MPEQLRARTLLVRHPGNRYLIATGGSGLFYAGRGAHQEEEALYLRAVAICKKCAGDWHLALAANREHLTCFYEVSGRFS
ncbi:MAG TPA: hypothetical protein VGF67_33755 [Ktedonobacteraceae bacterium]|jgi:hypothetical protein